jgi:hypothetical protein
MERSERTAQLSQDEWAARYNMTLRGLGGADGDDPDDPARQQESAPPPETVLDPEPAGGPAPGLEVVTSLEITAGERGEDGADRSRDGSSGETTTEVPA